jgi:hypothetical protein
VPPHRDRFGDHSFVLVRLVRVHSRLSSVYGVRDHRDSIAVPRNAASTRARGQGALALSFPLRREGTPWHP